VLVNAQSLRVALIKKFFLSEADSGMIDSDHENIDRELEPKIIVSEFRCFSGELQMENN